MTDGYRYIHHTSSKPDGSQGDDAIGYCFGIGYCIVWQRDSLVGEGGTKGACLLDVLGACQDELRYKNSLFPCEENELAIASSAECINTLSQAGIEQRKDNSSHAHHWENRGKPDGGQSFGIGYCIAWQRGSLVEEGRNGAFLIEVLEDCLDELRQKNSLPPEEKEKAIASLTECINTLKARIERRKNDGTYGTHIPDDQSQVVAH